MSWQIFWVSQDKVETVLTKEQTNMGMPVKKFHPSLGKSRQWCPISCEGTDRLQNPYNIEKNMAQLATRHFAEEESQIEAEPTKQ